MFGMWAIHQVPPTDFDIQESCSVVKIGTGELRLDFCRLAGDDELADKIRRTVRSRPSGQETGEDESGEDEPGNVTDTIGDVEEFSQEV